jgi:hypothetical protein
MLNHKGDHVQRPESAARPVLSIRAMAFAQKIAAEYQALETGYRNGRYKFIGSALTSYRKFLKDPDGYEALLSADNIAGLRGARSEEDVAVGALLSCRRSQGNEYRWEVCSDR